jgi:hypothetical protein
MSRGTILIGLLTSIAVSPVLLAQQIQRFGGEAERGSTRIAYFGQNTSEGQFVIDYGRPEWKADYDAKFDELTKGKRWRFGNNFWTTLDTHLDLTIAGAQVARGYYYLVLERTEGDDWYLVLLDPKQIQAKKLDAFMAEQTRGGIRAPLKWEKVEQVTPKLTVNLIPTEDDLTKASLEILWGTHKLTAPIDVTI